MHRHQRQPVLLLHPIPGKVDPQARLRQLWRHLFRRQIHRPGAIPVPCSIPPHPASRPRQKTPGSTTIQPVLSHTHRTNTGSPARGRTAGRNHQALHRGTVQFRAGQDVKQEVKRARRARWVVEAGVGARRGRWRVYKYRRVWELVCGGCRTVSKRAHQPRAAAAEVLEDILHGFRVVVHPRHHLGAWWGARQRGGSHPRSRGPTTTTTTTHQPTNHPARERAPCNPPDVPPPGGPAGFPGGDPGREKQSSGRSAAVGGKQGMVARFARCSGDYSVFALLLPGPH